MLLPVGGGFIARAWRCRRRPCGGIQPDNAVSRAPSRFEGLRLAFACWAALSCGPLFAGQYDYGGGYGLAHDSNITRTPYPQPEWTNALFAGIAYEEHTVDVNARFLAQGEQRYYVFKVFPDDFSAYVSGAAIWTMSPQLSWVVEENFRQVRVNLTQPDVPTNRTEISSFTTGPDLTIRFDPVNSAEVGGRYERFDIKGPGDSQRLFGRARLIHRVSPSTTLSANYEAARINFEDAVTFPQILRMDGFLRFEARPSPHEVTLDIGFSRVIRPGAAELDGRLGRASLARHLTPDTTLQLSYLSQYSDTFTDSLRGIANPLFPGDSAIVPGADVVTGDLYYLQRGEVDFVSGAPGARFGYSLRGYARKVDYLTQPLDFDDWGAWLDVGWRPSVMTRVYLVGRYSRRTFLDFVETDIDSTRTAGVAYALNRNMTMSFELSRTSHASTVPLSGYVDWRGVLLLGYSTGPLYSAQSRR